MEFSLNESDYVTFREITARPDDSLVAIFEAKTIPTGTAHPSQFGTLSPEGWFSNTLRVDAASLEDRRANIEDYQKGTAPETRKAIAALKATL